MSDLSPVSSFSLSALSLFSPTKVVSGSVFSAPRIVVVVFEAAVERKARIFLIFCNKVDVELKSHHPG